jgi:hypothetical protein
VKLGEEGRRHESFTGCYPRGMLPELVREIVGAVAVLPEDPGRLLLL